MFFGKLWALMYSVTSFIMNHYMCMIALGKTPNGKFAYLFSIRFNCSYAFKFAWWLPLYFALVWCINSLQALWKPQFFTHIQVKDEKVPQKVSRSVFCTKVSHQNFWWCYQGALLDSSNCGTNWILGTSPVENSTAFSRNRPILAAHALHMHMHFLCKPLVIVHVH